MRALLVVTILGAGLTALYAFAGPLFEEEVACRDVPEAQRDASILTNPENIRSVESLQPPTASDDSRRRAGARILLRAAPGMTAEGLQKIATCHLAWIAAARAATRSTRSPLDVRGASVVIKPDGDAFKMDVTSSDVQAARAILVRARALSPRPARAR